MQSSCHLTNSQRLLVTYSFNKHWLKPKSEFVGPKPMGLPHIPRGNDRKALVDEHLEWKGPSKTHWESCPLLLSSLDQTLQAQEGVLIIQQGSIIYEFM
jgi:hypothetical protein